MVVYAVAGDGAGRRRFGICKRVAKVIRLYANTLLSLWRAFGPFPSLGRLSAHPRIVRLFCFANEIVVFNSTFVIKIEISI